MRLHFDVANRHLGLGNARGVVSLDVGEVHRASIFLGQDRDAHRLIEQEGEFGLRHIAFDRACAVGLGLRQHRGAHRLGIGQLLGCLGSVVDQGLRFHRIGASLRLLHVLCHFQSPKWLIKLYFHLGAP